MCIPSAAERPEFLSVDKVQQPARVFEDIRITKPFLHAWELSRDYYPPIPVYCPLSFVSSWKISISIIIETLSTSSCYFVRGG